MHLVYRVAGRERRGVTYAGWATGEVLAVSTDGFVVKQAARAMVVPLETHHVIYDNEWHAADTAKRYEEDAYRNALRDRRKQRKAEREAVG